MENAVEALEMTFAMLVFILALTLAFFVLGKVNAMASRIDLNRDTQYLQYIKELDSAVLFRGNSGELTGQTKTARIVTVEDIIVTLYNYSTSTQTIMIDLTPGPIDINRMPGNVFNDTDIDNNVTLFPAPGKFIFGLDSFGAFNHTPIEGDTDSEGLWTGSFQYCIFQWGAHQADGTAGAINPISIREYIDAFVSGKKVYPVNIQKKEEYITARKNR